MALGKERIFYAGIFLLMLGILVYKISVTGNYIYGKEDSIMYVLHTRNLAEGKAYAPENYLQNPYHPTIGPNFYPPVYPALLVPFYFWNKENIHFYSKILNLLFLAGSFLLLLKLFRYENFPLHYGFGIALLVFFSPRMQDVIAFRPLPDVPFIFLSYLILYVVLVKERSIVREIALGVLFYLAYGTRSNGIVFPVMYFVYVLVKREVPSGLIALCVFGVLYLIQRSFLPSQEKEYVNMFAFLVYPEELSPSVYVKTLLQNYIHKNFYERLFLRYSATKSLVMLTGLLVTFGIVIKGFLQKIKTRLTFTEFYVSGLLLFVLAWGFGTFRYIFPVIPFGIMYFLSGLETFFPFLHRKMPAYVFIVGAFFMLSYAHLGKSYDTEKEKALIETARYIHRNISEKSVIVSDFSRFLAFYTKAGHTPFCHPKIADSLCRNYYRSVGARYFLLEKKQRHKKQFFKKRDKRKFRKIFENAYFVLYEKVADELSDFGDKNEKR